MSCLSDNVTENMMDADHPVWSFQEYKPNSCYDLWRAISMDEAITEKAV
ncbi:hypothetical protein [Flammeovirga aprica]|uniref:Uncharacterized protein n=1 Tax=Flammeovirga aprica JL-4 TaxID=694437 RepID=A0A7X9XDM7_9BACT|nr:hypothetical protein [Flammeovirga aprica]NME72958.1 hypothetical protein [Flammeovirga aprica JL-4]